MNLDQIIFIGQKGCGKSERARLALGMTHEEYEKHGQFIQKMIDDERRHKEFMEQVAATSYFYLVEQLRKERDLE